VTLHGPNPRRCGLQAFENKALSRGIIGKPAHILAEIAIRKSQTVLIDDRLDRQSRYPRAYARGTWELKPKIQLEFARVGFLLKFHISFDDVFVDPDRGGEETD
jgi:hypothetical protein